ncbi:dipeptidase [Muricoccus radiodurans]|uniref:dipeptidase n=1 Tax=Muricoccus radiodurans TaxID=2231721 RepID=UPI003CE6D0AE
MIRAGHTRRDSLRALALGAAGLGLGGRAVAQAPVPEVPILMDGHVHITNRVYWEGIDPWQPQPVGWDYARAKAAGVNVIIENVGTYGAGNFNTTARHALRLIETFHRTIERNADKMGLAVTAAEARRIAASGRMAVFLGIESGFDHEGDPDLLRAFHRLGLRTVQFATQTSFNAFADSDIAGPPHWNGINERGRMLVALMNELGILIDVTHATAEAQAQIIAASRAPVVASHTALAAVTGAGGLTDEVLRALAAKGGMVGIHGGAGAVGRRYRAWVAANPDRASRLGAAVNEMVRYNATGTRPARDHGEFGAGLDAEIRARHMAAFAPWQDDPEAAALVPTPDEWAEQVNHVIRTVGADHVGIGLDLVGGRSSVPRDSGGYPDLVAALNRITTPENVRKITGENWLRVLDRARAG